jgi:hypothetical protein
LVVLVAAAILFDEAALVISIVLAFVVVALLVGIWRIIRRGRWWSRALLGAAILAVLCGGLVIAFLPPGNSPSTTNGGVSVQYQATGVVNDQTVTVHEEIFLDGTFFTNISRALNRPNQQITAADVTIEGWALERTLNGYPVYANDVLYSIVPTTSLLKDRVTMPISLGSATVTLPNHPVSPVVLVPADGSELRLTSSRSAVSALSPPASQRADLPDGQELIVVPLSSSDETVSADVLKPLMRHPIGVKINEVFGSGILPAAEWFALTAAFAALRSRLLGYGRHVLKGWRRRRNKPDRDGAASATTGKDQERMADAG